MFLLRPTDKIAKMNNMVARALDKNILNNISFWTIGPNSKLFLKKFPHNALCQNYLHWTRPLSEL